MRRKTQDPLSVAFRQERHVAYGNVSYGNSPAGTAEPFLPDGGGHPEAVRAHRLRVQCRVVHFRGCDEDEVLPLLEKHLGAMRKGSPARSCPPTPALKPGREVTVLDKQQAVLVVGVPGVDVVSPRPGDLP